MSTKEIITLQLGHYANFVGTHWWNIQESSFQYGSAKDTEQKEEIDHDVLFREGETSRGEITFTPRLILTELKGGLRSLKSNGVLYDEDTSDEMATTWHGDTRVYKQPLEKKNDFLVQLDEPPERAVTFANGDQKSSRTLRSPRSYNLEKDVSVWSDYLRTFLHPKSMLIVNEYSHNSTNDPFDVFSKGSGLKHTLEELEERIRFYAEECDLMQGFHILADSHNGFAGLASSLLPYLHDEFCSKRLLTFPMFPGQFDNDSLVKSSKRDLTRSLLLPTFLEHSSFVCPLSLCAGRNTSRDIPHVLYDANLSYHTSAILASALDTLTLSHRLKGGSGVTLDQFCNDIVSQTKNLASLSLSLPFPTSGKGASLLTLDKQHAEGLSTCITPDAHMTCNEIVGEFYSQCQTLRGVSLETPQIHQSPLSQQIDSRDVLQYHMDVKFRGCHNAAYVRQSSMKTSDPFPQFFSKSIDKNGFIVAQHSHFRSLFQVPPSIKANGLTNGSHPSTLMNGEALCSGNSKLSQCVVGSVPLFTNLECSSKLADVLKSAVTRLQMSSKRHFSLHVMEEENLGSEIELLRSLQDEYESDQKLSSGSDEDF